MKKVREVTSFLLFGNLLIACSSVALCLHSALTCSLGIPNTYLLLVFFATIATYSFHSLIKPENFFKSEKAQWLKSHLNLMKVICGLSTLATIILAATMPWILLWMIPIALLTFLYSLPRLTQKMPLLTKQVIYWKTIYLTLVWTAVTYILPIVVFGPRTQPGELILGVLRFFFILQVAILFEYRDRDESDHQGLKIMFNQISENSLYFVFLLFSVVIQLGALYLVFRTGYQIFLSLLLPELSLLLLYKKATSEKSDYWYYSVIDGHLLLPWIILFILNRI